MTDRILLDEALDHVDAEREATGAKRRAFDRFADRVAGIEPRRPTGGGVEASGGWTTTGATASSDGCREVRLAFSELVEPHADGGDNGSIHRTIAAELSREVAVSLAANGGGGTFTPQLKRAVRDRTAKRVAECTAMERALGREAEQLSDAVEAVGPILAGIVEMERTTPLDLGFEELAARHRRFDEFGEQLSDLAESRQTFLRGTTSSGLSVGIRHEALVEYLYATLAVDFPVLATVARLDEVRRRKQRTIRDRLTRRV